MRQIPFHRSSLNYIDWHQFSKQLQKLKTFQGSASLQVEVSKICQEFSNGEHYYFVNSGTAALELALMALKLESGDEVILPSLTFTSCANSILRAGAQPVFCEVALPNLHLCLESIKALVTSNTKAIMVVEYAGIRSDLAKIREFCDQRAICLILDAAQSFGAAGPDDHSNLADFVCYSFHDTKVFSCGEGGLLIVNNDRHLENVETMLEKGTDRRKFFNGSVDKYTWQGIGSSFILSDINLLLLSMQIKERGSILHDKMSSIRVYDEYFHQLKNDHLLSFSKHSKTSNGHIFWLLLKDKEYLIKLKEALKQNLIESTTHYVPLHSAPFSKVNKFRYSDSMDLTNIAGESLLRLPVLSENEAIKVVSILKRYMP